MRTIAELIKAVHREAIREPFPVDIAIYERAEKDPTAPILFAGNLDADVCVFGRDLGKDEVAAGQPLVGAGGRLVRAGVYEAKRGKPPEKSNRRIEEALEDVLLTNTVPFKPPGNKAYAESVKARFRPFIAELLVDHWKGDQLLSLGTEAFRWFAPFADPDGMDRLWAREDRYEAEIACQIVAGTGDDLRSRSIRLCPLPHPSPLNQRWYGLFPGLLARRLGEVRP